MNFLALFYPLVPLWFLASLHHTHARLPTPRRSCFLILAIGRSHIVAFRSNRSLECRFLQVGYVIYFSTQLQSWHVSKRSIDETEQCLVCDLLSMILDYSLEMHSVSKIPYATRIEKLDRLAWVQFFFSPVSLCFSSEFSLSTPFAFFDCCTFFHPLHLLSSSLEFSVYQWQHLLASCCSALFINPPLTIWRFWPDIARVPVYIFPIVLFVLFVHFSFSFCLRLTFRYLSFLSWSTIRILRS